MLTQITRYVAIITISMHSLLCGGVFCCAATCSVDVVTASVSHDNLPSHAPTCPCHSEKQDSPLENEKADCDNSKYVCEHQHHFCQCLQSVTPNNGSAFRVILNQNIHSLPDAFLSTTATIPITALNPRTPETVGDWSAHGVRLHLLLEHFLI
jgi:hypothetical protein